ncbi:DUF4317 domain-containing protein [Oribacterium sinus]|uniref:DUF4317 domain-containing protein n=1 Tax=Oribacterium sinus F0268 TaxID=585501 RepID=C2KU35_9FIRM|nr:DUF4317 domain-containing protein [Oribacterium sinus]EEJ52720.1 hypothetical protein HMPREF6123_0004 [Oribacterium sinus F0268]
MDKKGIAEVKKCFKKEDCRIDRMVSCFVNEEGEVISRFSDSFYALEDKELFKYCELFKQSLSGKLGRNLYTLAFPLEEEKEGGKQQELYQLLQSELKEEALYDAFFEKIRKNYPIPGKHLLLLAHGVYDVPKKTTDGLVLEDASENVYSFLLFTLCPVSLLKEGLCFDQQSDSFISRSEDFVVQKPEISFLYPAFHDRNSDIHELLYRCKKREDSLDSVPESLFGTPLPMGEKQQKHCFSKLVEEILQEDCTFENIRLLQEELAELQNKENEEEREQSLPKNQVKALLEKAGATEEQLLNFSSLYEEELGEKNESLFLENLADSTLRLDSDNVHLRIKNEVSAILESRIIDGKEYLLLPISDNLECNGISIRRKLTEKEEQ